MNLRKLFHSIYFNDTRLTVRDYYISRQFFIFEGGTARGVFALTSGAFLAGYARYLGASESFNGIIAAIPALAGIFQLFSPMVFEKISQRKFLISILCLFHRLSLGLMVLIPVLFSSSTARVWMLAILYFISYSLAHFLTPAAANWIVSLTHDSSRGKYFGIRDSYILAFATVLTLVMGKVLDLYKVKGFEFSGFIINFIVVIVLTAANFLFISSIKEPRVEIGNVSLDLKSIITTPLKDKTFRKIITMFIIWNIGLHVGLPFFAVYLVTRLQLSYTYIMVMSMISSLVNVIVVRFWGKLADRKSWMHTSKLSIGLLAVSHFIWLFMNAKTAFVLVPLVHVLGGAAWAGLNISLFNVQFSYSPEAGRTVYLGFNAALGGVIGFLVALCSSTIVGTLSDLNVGPAGFDIGNIQIIFGLSGIILALCVLYAHIKFKGDA